MPRGVSHAVVVLGVFHVDDVEGARQRGRGGGNADDVDMIRHQAPGPYFEAEFSRIPGEPLAVTEIIIRLDKYGPPVIPPLRDVVGVADSYRSGHSWHGIFLKPADARSQ